MIKYSNELKEKSDQYKSLLSSLSTWQNELGHIYSLGDYIFDSFNNIKKLETYIYVDRDACNMTKECFIEINQKYKGNHFLPLIKKNDFKQARNKI